MTSKAPAYFFMVARLRKAGVPFRSLVPGSDHGECDLVLTTADEAHNLGPLTLVFEHLSSDPGVFKGQVVSKLAERVETLLIGIDPGKRTGIAVFYGHTNLSSGVFDSDAVLCSRIRDFVSSVPSGSVLVRIGGGDKASAFRLVDAISRQVPEATIEVVDESGTSTRSSRVKGQGGDQGSAARIAFRKGEVVSPGSSRISGRERKASRG